MSRARDGDGDGGRDRAGRDRALPAARRAPPTRRVFVALLGVAAAGLAVRRVGTERASRSISEVVKTRWIGHC